MQTAPMEPGVKATQQDRTATCAARQAQAKAEQWEALARARQDSLLRDNKFYLSRSISPQRCLELRTLIQSNGGEVLKRVTPGAVELVENKSLKEGKEWVSVDFVFDSVRDQCLRDPRQYMVAHQFKGRGRLNYTVEENAKMLLFLDVTSHSPFSMLEHHRKVLSKLTPQERRNMMKHAEVVSLAHCVVLYVIISSSVLIFVVVATSKDEERARQRQELAAINAANPKVLTKTATTGSPAEEKMSTPEIASTEAQISEATPVEPPVAEEANNVSTPENESPETKSSVPVVDGGTEAKEDENGEVEEEEIQGRSKKQGRKSAVAPAAAHQTPASPNKKETPRKEAVAEAEDSQKPTVTPTAAAAAAVTARFEPADDSAGKNNSNDEPKMPSKKQQKQKLKRNVASSQREEEDKPAEKASDLTKPGAGGDTKKMAHKTGNYPPASPPSREVGTGGIFFRSRWEQLINDTSNRHQLQQYFNLACQNEAPTSPAPAARGKNQRKPTSSVRAIAAAPSPVKNNVDETTTPTAGSSAGTTTRRRQRVEAPAAADEEEKEETMTRSTKPAPSKKQKVRPTSQQQKAAEVPQAATVAQVEEIVVASESEVDSLTCQLQFATDQELNTVTHALYYSSGDVEVALSFLQDACPADFWSEEDDLLLADLVSDTTDARKVVDARRRGAFASMRVQRTTAQILARIRYLL